LAWKDHRKLHICNLQEDECTSLLPVYHRAFPALPKKSTLQYSKLRIPDGIP
jgi:hypothetical protein